MTRIRSTVIRWFWHGPGEDDGLIGWIVGMWLWWRILASTGIFVIPIWLIAFATFSLGVHSVTVGIIAFFFGTWAGTLILKASPKYEVTRNF